MHIDEIIAALAANDLGTIKEAFLALANYPKQEQVTGLRAGNAMTFLEAAAGRRRSLTASAQAHSLAEACSACMRLSSTSNRIA
jgi:hypothetical protein